MMKVSQSFRTKVISHMILVSFSHFQSTTLKPTDVLVCAVGISDPQIYWKRVIISIYHLFINLLTVSI